MKKIVMGLYFFALNSTLNTTNKTGETGATPWVADAEMTTFFHKRLIMLAGPQRRYAELASVFNIPRNAGKTVDIRIPEKAKAKLDQLTEGVNPDGSKLEINHVQATLGLYGDVVPLTSFLEATAFDDVFKISFDHMAEEAGITLDTMVRNAALEGTNKIYAPTWSGTTPTTVSKRYALDNTAVFTFDLAFKAAAQLAAEDAPKFDGYYAAVIHPFVKYDLQVNQHLNFNDVVKYAKPEKIMKGEIGELAGIRFLESSLAKVYKGAKLGTVAENLTIAASVTTTDNFTVSDTIDASIVGRQILLGLSEPKVVTVGAVDVTNKKITVSEDVTVGPSTTAYPGEAGKNNAAVFATVVCGKDAFMRGSLDGEGDPYMMIVKSAEQAGGPLNMFSTVGWRATTAAAKTVNKYLVIIETGSTMGGSIVEEN